MEKLKPCAVQVNCLNKSYFFHNIVPAVYAAIAVSDLVTAPFKHAKRMVCERGYAAKILGSSACFTAGFLMAAACGSKNLAVSAPEAVVICMELGLLAGQLLGVATNIGFPEERVKRTNNFTQKMRGAETLVS